MKGTTIAVRHPIQAGRVSRTFSGRFVPSADNSWLAKGDKAWSACATTKTNKVRCSPLIASQYMADVDVAVSHGMTGPILTFSTAPGSRRTSKATALSVGVFLRRLATASAHLERQAVSYAPKRWEKSVLVGQRSNVTMASGEGCGGYDDFGSYDCVGGEGGGGGGGGGEEGGSYEVGGYGGGGEGGSYPSNDPPPFDPATGEGIDPNAPEVIIVGERPEQPVEAPVDIDWARIDWANPPRLPEPEIVPIGTNVDVAVFIPAGCFPGPRGTVVCPPAPPATATDIPSVTIPGQKHRWKWPNWKLCKLLDNCEPKAQEGSQPDAPATHPDDILHDALKACAAQAKADAEYCVRISKFRFPPNDPEQNRQCVQDAIDNYKACEMTAIDLHKHAF